MIEQDDAEREGERERALGGLEHGGGGENARLPGEVAADHQGRADLGDHRAEARHAGGEQRQPRFDGDGPQRAEPAGAERLHLQPEVRVDCCNAAVEKPATSGSAIAVCAITIAVGV